MNEELHFCINSAPRNILDIPTSIQRENSQHILKMIRMKKIITILISGLLFLGSCDSSNDEKTIPLTPILKITASEPGCIYLDGKYTGYKTPKELAISRGEHTIGVALEQNNTYLRKQIVIDDDKTELHLNESDLQQPKIWKALWVGIENAQGTINGKTVNTHFSKEELDEAYNYFQWSLREHFEKFSYGTMKWESERIDLSEPVNLNHSPSSNWYVLEPSTIYSHLPEIEEGDYDCIFTFWREQEGTISFASSYFGLAWTKPMAEAKKIGYVTIKFNAGDNIVDAINYYKNNDPGVWVHEWLHTVGENFFQDKGLILPQKGGDGLVVHGAEVHHYSYPWMNWYRDFISGRVKDNSSSQIWVGIGPDAFLECNLRETATGECSQ
jgi:hypothetical protein